MEESQVKIKEIFLKAIELPETERDEFIRTQCKNDDELLNEVLSLVENHNERSLFETPTQERIDIKSKKKEESEFEITLKKIQKKKSKKLKYNLVLIGIILTLITIGIWTQQRMKSSILNINEHSLKHNLDATILSLDEWIKSQENIVVALAKDSLIIESVDYLTNKYGLGKFGHKDSIWKDPVHIRLVKRMDPILEVLESPSFSIVDVSGFRIATNLYQQLGAQINEIGFKELVPSLQHEGPKFTRPYLQETYTENNSDVSFDVPITWVDCAIKKENISIASLGLTFYAESGFNEVLSIHRIGKNGHTYAFDENGLLVSSILDVDELIEYGIIEEGQDPMLNMHLINPEEVIKNRKIDLEKYRSSPQILPVRNALVDKNMKVSSVKALSSPYITFNGQKVIGAYVWLPKYNIGIITELPADETLEPVHYLNLILIILIGLLIGFVLYSFISSYQVAKLHKEIGETSKLGQYTLIKHIGEGGMGEVYLAKHTFLSRPNAVKLLKEELSHNKDTVKRFEREVQLASQLTNPHTIQIHDFGYTQGDRFYYAMEYLEGCTLSDLIKIEGNLPINRVIYLMRQICYSLQETHEHGLVHRDIKPMNIMICKLGGMYDYVKVLDFGLVKDIEGGEDLEMTQEAYIQGTPVYMAPERFLRPQLNDPKSDIYSIGMVAYYLITGRKVFDHIDRTSLLSEILNAQPKEMDEFTNETLPKAFSDIIMKCLEKDLDNRPASIKELLTVIDSIDISEWEQSDAKSWWERNIEHES